MSVYESISIMPALDLPAYVAALAQHCGLIDNRAQAGTVSLDGQHFYAPINDDGETGILSFNHAGIPPAVLQVLLLEPSLASPTTRITWMIEQDVLWQGTLAEWQALPVSGQPIPYVYFPPPQA